ncbi:hypothetical protein ACL2XP_10120 [Sodalis sp. RH21]
MLNPEIYSPSKRAVLPEAISTAASDATSAESGLWHSMKRSV